MEDNKTLPKTERTDETTPTNNEIMDATIIPPMDAIDWINGAYVENLGDHTPEHIPERLNHIPETLKNLLITPEEMRAKTQASSDNLEFKITALHIPEGTKVITRQMIYPYMDTLEEIYIPSSVETIGAEAFSHCKKLKKVEMAEGVKRICINAFSFCESLQEIFIPKTVERIEPRFFDECKSLDKIEIDKDNKFYANLGGNAIIKKDVMKLIALWNNATIPNGVKVIGSDVFRGREDEEIIIPEGVKEIEKGAIFLCPNLKKIFIPSSVENIGGFFLRDCPNLEEIIVDEENRYYKDLGCNAIFNSANQLMTMSNKTIIPEGCTEILSSAFMGSKIETLHIPSTIEKIDLYSNGSLPNLSKITVSKDNEIYSDGREYLANGILKDVEDDKVSCNCIIEKENHALIKACKNTIIPNAIKYIGVGAFASLDIKTVKLPDSVEWIDSRAFQDCKELENVKLNDNLKFINWNAFRGCKSLKTIEIPKNVEVIRSGSFAGNNLDSIIVNKENEYYSDYDSNVIVDKNSKTLLAGCKNSVIPNEVEKIEEDAFSETPIKSIEIPESVKYIGGYAFRNCKDLKTVVISKNVEFIGKGAFDGCTALEDKTFHYKTRISINHNKLIFGAKVVYENETFHFKDLIGYGFSKFGFVGELEDRTIIYPNLNGELTKTTREEVTKKENKFNELTLLSLAHIYKMEKWNQYDSVPSHIIVELMPYEEIGLFYKDNNKKNWQMLIKASQYSSDNEKGSLFALAHALGVFSESGAESKEATEFILHEILANYTGEQLHSAMGGFDVDNTPYNPEFAKFFMHNFSGFDFMILKEEGEEINLLSACHNNFKDVQKEYPEKKVITRNDRERLTPELAMQVLGNKQYENVKENAKKLAVKVGRLGYNQQQFETLQDWYLTAISIPKEDLAIVCKKDDEDESIVYKKDDEDEPITYEVLAKDDPLGAVIGTLTNCCQVVGGAGQKCVEYGMTQPNSTFIAFRQGERLIGQAWVWYDKETGQVTLDNIEVPDKVMNNLKNVESMRESIIDCLNRLGVNLVKSMNANFEEQGKTERVNKVTIGLGCNDFKKFLLSNYQQTKDIKELTGYDGYSDAKKRMGQVTVVELEKENIVIREKEKNKE